MNVINGVILIEEMKSLPLWLQIVGGLAVTTVLIIDIFIVKKAAYSFAKGKILIPSLLSVLCITLLVTAGAFAKGEIGDFKVPNGEYRVFVTEAANMDEFLSTYEIVEYKDGVYTIKNKDADVN